MKTPTVLLMLEKPHDLEVYGASLRDGGYETLACTSPSEGITFLENEDVSLVIVAQGSPAFEGRQVLERSRRLHPEAPVLVFARALDLHFYGEAMDLGAIGYLLRPKPRDLVWVVDTLVSRGAMV